MMSKQWSAEALGERGISDKKLRRANRDAHQAVRVRESLNSEESADD